MTVVLLARPAVVLQARGALETTRLARMTAGTGTVTMTATAVTPATGPDRPTVGMYLTRPIIFFPFALDADIVDAVTVTTATRTIKTTVMIVTAARLMATTARVCIQPVDIDAQTLLTRLIVQLSTAHPQPMTTLTPQSRRKLMQRVL